mmetsp:Transcript_61000/g.141041  ORF Transcript_61000/g.141041 Transcript_61000/m.141041 type:complete len:182 (-) Transcript_61000:74-619(-)
MSRKLKVLCFHGFRTSGNILRTQLGFSFAGHLDDLVDFVFVDGAHLCTPEEYARAPPGVKQYFPDEQLHEWWNREAIAGTAESELLHYEDTLAHIGRILETQGPFDGVLGFSQGALLATLCVVLQRSGELPGAPLKFAVVMSGLPISLSVAKPECYSECTREPCASSIGAGPGSRSSAVLY